MVGERRTNRIAGRLRASPPRTFDSAPGEGALQKHADKPSAWSWEHLLHLGHEEGARSTGRGERQAPLSLCFSRASSSTNSFMSTSTKLLSTGSGVSDSSCLQMTIAPSAVKQ